MIRKPSLWKAYVFIRKNRFLKKRKVNKMALELMIDKTTAVYLILLGGYVFASLFIFGDFMKEFNDYFIFMEENARKGFWLLLTALPIRYIMKSFREPGLKFSSSEFQLSILPYSRAWIWLLALLEKWIRQVIVYMVMAGLVILLTPISSSLIVSYLGLILFYDVIMSVPQWKLFQTKFLTKIGWLLFVIIINAFGVLTASPLVGLILISAIIVLNFILLRSLFSGINWSKVTEISDYHIWNMWLIGKASYTKFKKQKKYSIFQNSAKRKKPFQSQKSIHNRIWKLYLSKNYELLFQLLGVLLLMLVVLLFLNESIFHIGLAVAVYAYTSVAASFFGDRFQADILHVLPWDLSHYKESFFKWVLYGGTLLLLPVLVYLGMDLTFWSPFQLLFYCSSFLYVYHVKVDKAVVLLAKRTVSLNVDEGLSLLFVVLIGFIGSYPMISITFVIILLLLRRRRNISNYIYFSKIRKK